MSQVSVDVLMLAPGNRKSGWHQDTKQGQTASCNYFSGVELI